MKGFVKRWLKDEPSVPEPVAPSIESGRRVYCIGDIHGRLDLMRRLHRKIEQDARRFDGRKVLVYLGDYIDRGPYSREVIEELLDNPLPEFRLVHLKGNHEQTLLDFLDYPEHAAGWLSWGGRETLMSYGVEFPALLGRGDFGELGDELRSRMPERHIEFLQTLPLFHVEGDYLFVHAGIRPTVPLAEQSDADLMWIRREFLEWGEQHAHVVVHGHSINEEVEMRPNRIGIDTGAFYTGVLTCLVLEGSERRLLQTGVE